MRVPNILTLAAASVLCLPLHAQEIKADPVNLSSILDSLEQAEAENPALSRAHEVTREYKVFRGDDPKPSSEVMAQVSFVPPDTKTFTLTEAQGNSRDKQFVTAILQQEVAAAKAGHKGDINRSNYDFVFLREQNFGTVPEYVLHIVPKRKEKGLLLGDIWVDAKTYHIRQIIGVPLKTPSFWIKDLNITIQFASTDGMWEPVSVDAIATVRLLGIFTLTARDLVPGEVSSRIDGAGIKLPTNLISGGRHSDISSTR
jgi:hypothetical protein